MKQTLSAQVSCGFRVVGNNADSFILLKICYDSIFTNVSLYLIHMKLE